MFKRLTCWFLIGVFSSPVLADDFSAFRVSRDPERPRDYVLSPLISSFLPGFDQWWEGQYGWAAGYTVVGGGALAYGLYARKDGSGGFGDDRAFGMNLGLKLYTTAGSFSSYHAFRSAVLTRQSSGEFSFLKYHESPLELMASPFRFDYLARVTTIVPLAAAAVLGFVVFPALDETSWKSGLSAKRAAYSGAISYMAGTSEEAFFRGTLMPGIMPTLNHSALLSNAISSTMFALAHYDPNNPFVPWPQLLAGLYFGYVTIERDWKISEPIFIHTWYDVIIFSAYFSYKQNAPVIQFPTLELHF